MGGILYDIKQDFVYQEGERQGFAEGFTKSFTKQRLKSKAKSKQKHEAKGIIKGTSEGKSAVTITGIRNLTAKDYTPELIAELLDTKLNLVKDIQKYLQLTDQIDVLLQEREALTEKLKAEPYVVDVLEKIK